VVAASARLRPEVPLAALAEDLRDDGGRLDALEAGDARTGVRATVSSSYRALRKRRVRAFTLLGLAADPT
jgi:hypothetical protein